MSETNYDYVVEQCPECGRMFALGITGTVDGCDRCTNTERNFAGQVIEEEDSLTDMEKA